MWLHTEYLPKQTVRGLLGSHGERMAVCKISWWGSLQVYWVIWWEACCQGIWWSFPWLQLFSRHIWLNLQPAWRVMEQKDATVLVQAVHLESMMRARHVLKERNPASLPARVVWNVSSSQPKLYVFPLDISLLLKGTDPLQKDGFTVCREEKYKVFRELNLLSN